MQFNTFTSIRKIIAKIICCKPEEVILTQSTTDGINIVANGLSFNDSSNIIIRGMTHEHHSNFYPWIKLKDKISIRNLSIDQNGFFKLEDLKLVEKQFDYLFTYVVIDSEYMNLLKKSRYYITAGRILL